jgi:hypothetical protein
LSINNLFIQALGTEPEEKLLQSINSFFFFFFILAEMYTKTGKFRKVWRGF